MAKKPNYFSLFDKQLLTSEAYARQVQRLLDDLSDDALKLVLDSGYDGKKFFRFADNKDIERHFEELQSKNVRQIKGVIVDGIEDAWQNSNIAADALVVSVLWAKASQKAYSRYFSNNEAAMEAFIRRQRNGLNLSQRIWRIEDEFKEAFEGAISTAIQDGTSAAQLSRTIRQYLREPDKLFRRIAVYNDKGHFDKFKLSQPALKYNPGAGMYRSSYRNAMRLAATEINMAYRSADQLRWSQLDFVVGYEVKRSNHPYPCPVCEALKGRYPKNFIWQAWHPNCRCHCIPVLKSREEIDKDDDLILSGGEPTSIESSKNFIGDVPDNYIKWVKDNEERIHRAQNKGTLPFFLRENPYSEILKR